MLRLHLVAYSSFLKDLSTKAIICTLLFMICSTIIVAQTCTTQSWNTGASIPDNNATGTSQTVTFTSTAPIVDVNVTLDITHTWDDDLDIILTSPAGTTIILSTDNGGSGSNYTNTIFDDAAATPVTTGSAPFNGLFSPEQPLSSFNGESPNGVWTLNISDDFSGDTGTLNSFSIEVCDATVSGLDTDGDGITDEFDLDDDNDGITDLDENINCTGTTIQNLFIDENFGAGNRTSSIYTNYLYENGSGVGGSSVDVGDGEYAVLQFAAPFNINTGASTFGTWLTNTQIQDHTGDVNGRMAVFNAAFSPGEFYNRPISGVLANLDVTLSFWVLNIVRSGSNIILPNVTYEIRDASNNLITSGNTGDIPENNQWNNFTITFDPGVNTQLRLILINNAPGGSGNDLALDDIQLFQETCDFDGDGVANQIDLDSDNDGIYDLVESGVLSISAINDTDNDGRIDGVAADFGTNGLHSAIENNDTQAATLTYTITDTDADGIRDAVEIDADNDGCNDVFEAGFTDSNDDGILAALPTLVSTDGLVTDTGVVDGYTAPDPKYLNVFINTCTNTDGDTAPDLSDLDDDNDGILDSEECGTNILWVTEGTAGTEEQNTIDKLIALGYTVTVVDDNVGGNADNFDVTFIYEDVSSGSALGNVNNITTTANGVITSENALHDDILGASPGATTTTNLVNIANNTHPITAGLPLGSYDIGDAVVHAIGLTTGTALGFHPNGEVSIAAWEVGDAMEVGIAPGRRVIVPHGNAVGGFNDKGEDLLVNAIIWAAGRDTDSDGLDDCFDLDSDNDGIYDAVEAGHGQSHTNGRVDGTVGTDGVPDAVQASPNSGTTNYTLTDSDSDGNIDNIEADSDNDGCNDADEAYGDANTDTDDNGMFGSGNPTINGDGSVAAATYSAPVDGDSNSTPDHLEAGFAILIITQPADLTLCPGCDGLFTATITNANGYQWQIFDGSTWVNLIDTGIYSGTTTNTLSLINVTTAETGNQYRVIATNSALVCQIATSSTVTLRVQANTVITNRRITYRVRKN